MTSWTRPDDERPVRPLEMEGGVAAEGDSECGDDQTMKFEEPEAEAGRRNPVKVQDECVKRTSPDPAIHGQNGCAKVYNDKYIIKTNVDNVDNVDNSDTTYKHKHNMCEV